jgi:hypothetical protein
MPLDKLANVKIVFFQVSQTISALYFCWYFAFNAISYGATAVCGYKIVEFVQLHSMPEKEQKMNRQLTRSLLAMVEFLIS